MDGKVASALQRRKDEHDNRRKPDDRREAQGNIKEDQ